MNDVEEDTLEWEVKRQLATDVKRHKDMALILAKQLNEKIDECEELKSEVARLNNLILSMELSPAWKERA